MAIGLPLRKYIDDDELGVPEDVGLPKKPVNKNLKMYILILDWVDVGHAINSVGHAGLMGYLKWKHDPIIEEWLANSFRKVTCKVNQKEFEKAQTYGDFQVITELAFDGKAVGLVFKPRYEWPKFFKYLKLYK
jgi:hypothetical protein